MLARCAVAGCPLIGGLWRSSRDEPSLVSRSCCEACDREFTQLCCSSGGSHGIKSVVQTRVGRCHVARYGLWIRGSRDAQCADGSRWLGCDDRRHVSSACGRSDVGQWGPVTGSAKRGRGRASCRRWRRRSPCRCRRTGGRRQWPAGRGGTKCRRRGGWLARGKRRRRACSRKRQRCKWKGRRR